MRCQRNTEGSELLMCHLQVPVLLWWQCSDARAQLSPATLVGFMKSSGKVSHIPAVTPSSQALHLAQTSSTHLHSHLHPHSFPLSCPAVHSILPYCSLPHCSKEPPGDTVWGRTHLHPMHPHSVSIAPWHTGDLWGCRHSAAVFLLSQTPLMITEEKKISF